MADWKIIQDLSYLLGCTAGEIIGHVQHLKGIEFTYQQFRSFTQEDLPQTMRERLALWAWKHEEISKGRCAELLKCNLEDVRNLQVKHNIILQDTDVWMQKLADIMGPACEVLEAYAGARPLQEAIGKLDAAIAKANGGGK